MNPVPHGAMSRLLFHSAGNVNSERQTVRAKRSRLPLLGVLCLPVGGALRPATPGGRIQAVLRAALCLCLCAGLLPSISPVSLSGKNFFVGRAMAAESAEPSSRGASETFPPAVEAPQPAAGSASGTEVRSGKAPADEPLGSRELTRELYRLLRPEQTPARGPDGPASSPAPASGRPSASDMPTTLPAPGGAATTSPAEPVVTRPAAPATTAPAIPAASQPKAPETPRPKAPGVPPPKTPTAARPKAPTEISPKAPTTPQSAEPQARPQGTALPVREEKAPEKNPRPAGDALPDSMPVEAPREAGPLSPRDKGTTSFPEKGAAVDAKPVRREPPADSLPAGPGEQAKSPDTESAAGKGGEPAEAVARQNIVRAEIKSVNLTVLSAPYDGVVSAVLARDGDSVGKEQAVARLDTRAEEEALAVAQTLAAEVFNRLGALPEGPSRARDELAAEYLRYSAEVRGHENRLAQGVINAPFAGTVTEVHAKAGEHVKQGSPIVEIAESGNLEIVCAVPSAWVRWLKPGHIVWVYVDETAKSYEAVLDRLGGKVDPASKTIRVYARFSSPQTELLPGMSGSASIRPRLAEEKDGVKDLPERGPRQSGQGKSR